MPDEENNILISVVIPTHNRADALELTLAHLSGQDFSGKWEAIVVNNNCTDNTDEVVKSFKEKFPVPLHLIHESVPGPAAARNAGARKAEGEVIVFIDNDILVRGDFIERHYNRIQENPGCWFVGQVINLPEQESTVFGRYRKHLFPEVPADNGLKKIEGITGQTTSMRREDFDKLGGFDENFHVASGEDHELALRAQESGTIIYFDPGIIVLHNDWAGSSIRDFCRRQRLYTQTEPFFWKKYGEKTPRIEMVRKNLPPALKRDGVKLFLWKKTKGVLASDAGQSSIIKLCELSEKMLPAPKILWKLYRLAIAGAIYKGFQEGLAIYSINDK
ncbi:MAG TPA: glycosyltransferase [Pyrinomonadaceae bacterium]|jgi:GT2 family glycosyltransferase